MEDRICTDPKQARKELEEIAKELGLPIEDERVVLEWSNRGNWHNQRVADEVLIPLYYSKSKETTS